MVKGWVRCALLLQAVVLWPAVGCDSETDPDGAPGNAGASTSAGVAGVGPAGRGGSSAGGASGTAGASGASSGSGGAAGANTGDAGSDAVAGSAGAGEGGQGGDASDEPGGSAGVGAGTNGTGEAGTSGSAGSGPIVPITDLVRIITDDHGRVTPESNGIGISGNWYAENDCTTSPGDCTADHVIGPVLGEVPFDTRPYPTDSGKVCMKATSLRVVVACSVIESARRSVKRLEPPRVSFSPGSA